MGNTIRANSANTDLDLAARDLARAIKRATICGEPPADRSERIERAWRHYKTISTARRMAARNGN